MSATVAPSSLDYGARAQTLVPLLTEAASRTEAARELTVDVVAALQQAGFFRVLLPSWLDGGETAPSEFIETIARGDASTAWCLCQMNVCSLSSVYLSREAAQEVFGISGATLAWGNTPYAKAVRVKGGYRVTGDWDFGSGCHHATWLGGHCPVIDEQGNPVVDEDGLPADGPCCSRRPRRRSAMYGAPSACAAPQRPLFARRLVCAGKARDHHVDAVA